LEVWFVDLTVGLLVAVAIGLIIARATKRYEKRPYALAAVVAVATFASKEAIDRFSARRSDPGTAIEYSELKPGQIDLTIKNGHSIVDALELQFSVLGKVTGIDNMFSGTAHSPVNKSVIGYDTPYAQNTIQLHVPRLAADASILFTIRYEPRPADAPLCDVIGLNVVEYRYTWSHAGSMRERRRWISKISHLDAERPVARAIGAICVRGEEMQAWVEAQGEPRWRMFD
jgi:hypothetical protein